MILFSTKDTDLADSGDKTWLTLFQVGSVSVNSCANKSIKAIKPEYCQ